MHTPGHSLQLSALFALSAAAWAQEAASVQEALLRAKPAVAVVVTELASEVMLRCAGREVRVTSAPFRQTDEKPAPGWRNSSSAWASPTCGS
jgi:hypothetical protein